MNVLVYDVAKSGELIRVYAENLIHRLKTSLLRFAVFAQYSFRWNILMTHE